MLVCKFKKIKKQEVIDPIGQEIMESKKHRFFSNSLWDFTFLPKEKAKKPKVNDHA